MKYHIFYNMLAGLGDSKAKVEKLTESFDGELILHDVATTSYQELIASIDTEDIIVICGGDGTINRFVNDTYDLEYPNEVLYFPTGSGNDFMRDVEGTPEEPISIKQYIKNLPSVEVDGKTYRFINNVGFGLDGYCCAKGDDIKAAGGGTVNYTAIAIKGLLFHYKPTNAIVTVDGKEYRYKKVWIAPTMKGRYYGGGMIAATVNGKHELVNLEINPEAVDPDDVEMLQDMILAAVNEAMRAADAEAANNMSRLTGGLNLGGLF